MPMKAWRKGFGETFLKLKDVIEKEMGPVTTDGNVITFKNDGEVYQTVLYET